MDTTQQWEVRFCTQCFCAFDAPVPTGPPQRRGPQLCEECRKANKITNSRRQNKRRRVRVPA